jgi:protease I
MSDSKILEGKKIAILVTDGFEEIELTAPKEELQEYGAEIHVVAENPRVRSWKKREWGSEFNADRTIETAQWHDYDVLILPGGVINADRLRRNSKAIEAIKKMDNHAKLIAAICHGPQLLIEADLVRGRNMTSHRALATDMKNAGAEYEDYGVLVDENFITARGAEDVSAFLKKIIGILKE